MTIDQFNALPGHVIKEHWRINDETGFAAGDQWASEKEVRNYFRLETFGQMGWETELTQDELDSMADFVVENRLHCDF